MEWLKLVLLVICAFLLGSIPSGFVIGMRLGRDLRKHGSGKVGATNTLRVIGRRAAAVVFLLDAGKGAAAVAIARLLPWPGEGWLGVAMGGALLAAVVGHIWSVWIRAFTGKWGGGRGVATIFGSMLVVHPAAAVLALAAGILVIVITRYVSLGSIIGIGLGVVLLVFLWLFHQIDLLFLPWAVACGLLVVLAHYDNIQRLVKGTERKIGQRT